MKRRDYRRARPKRDSYGLGQLAPGALPESWRKEDLSIAYMHALATKIGVACDHSARDINGWDVRFAARDTPEADALQLNAQLKCTLNRLKRIDQGQSLSFPLDAADYNNLRMTPAHPPRLLVVVEVHDPSSLKWVQANSSAINLKASAWYTSLAGAAALSEGQESKSVRIPARQRFTASALLEHMKSCP